MGDLEGKVALVTGAGRNIGREVALALARRGTDVVVADLDPQRATAVVADIEALGSGASALAAAGDVSCSPDVAEVVGAAIERFGHIDILVNNVATTDRGATILDLAEEEWHRVLGITLTSVFLCSQQVARHMVDAGSGGSIVVIGSTSGYGGRGNALAYPTAKSALFGLTRSMAIQLGPAGIRVNLVAPNKAGSPVGKDEVDPTRPIRNLVGHPVEPTDIAEAVCFLVSPAARSITGVDLLVDGGATLAAPVD